MIANFIKMIKFSQKMDEVSRFEDADQIEAAVLKEVTSDKCDFGRSDWLKQQTEEWRQLPEEERDKRLHPKLMDFAGSPLANMLYDIMLFATPEKRKEILREMNNAMEDEPQS